VTRCSLALACAAQLASADIASARALVEPGDLVLGFGAEVVAVRADGSGVAPITPRPGSGANPIGTASGVAIDTASGRILVGNPLGELFVVDPDDGTQSPVTDALGEPLTVGQDISSIAALESSGFLVASSSFLSLEPSSTFGSSLYAVGPLATEPAPAVSVFAEIFDDFPLPPAHGLAVREPAEGGVQIFLSTLTPGGSALSIVDPVTRVRTDIPDVPVGSTSFIADVALDCPSGIASECALYWLESGANASGCISAAAVVYRAALGETAPVHTGPPLRCAYGLAVGADATLFVLDAESDGADPRIHRFDHDPIADSYTPVRIADASELPDPMPPYLPRMTVSSLALPEPASAGAGMLLALASLAAARAHAMKRPPFTSSDTPLT
jgi:hypothetical protein